MKSYFPIQDPIITGTFIKEAKNRFICTVEVNSVEIECYIPCSSQLKHFIDLVGKKVLLIPNKQLISRTTYSVLAVKHKRQYVILNTSLANKATYYYLSYNKNKLYRNDSLITMEKTVLGYKTDLLIEWQSAREIIEVKSIISLNRTALFPTVNSTRATEQLKKFLNLPDNIKMQYWLVSLSPYIEEIVLNSSQYEYCELFHKCLARGMILKAFQCSLIGNKVKITREIPVLTQ